MLDLMNAEQQLKKKATQTQCIAIKSNNFEKKTAKTENWSSVKNGFDQRPLLNENHTSSSSTSSPSTHKIED